MAETVAEINSDWSQMEEEKSDRRLRDIPHLY